MSTEQMPQACTGATRSLSLGTLLTSRRLVRLCVLRGVSLTSSGLASDISATLSTQLNGTDTDGLIGFAWPDAGADANSRPFWFNSLPDWPEPLFSVFLTRSSFSQVVDNSNSSNEYDCHNANGGVVTLG